MRRNFAQAIKVAKVDPKKEYTKLFELFYSKDERDGKSLADLISRLEIAYSYYPTFCERSVCLTDRIVWWRVPHPSLSDTQRRHENVCLPHS